MTIGGDLAGSRLSVALDLRHPLAYLALRPAITLGREFQLNINWLPLTAPALRGPSAPGASDDRGVRHKRHRTHMLAREIAVYSEVQGLTIKEPYRDAPVDAANLGWLFMRAHAPELLEPFLEELFRRYWALELGAADTRDIAAVVSTCEADAEAFLRWAASEGAAVAEAIANELAKQGVFTSPAYLVDDQVFYGRQHLPMIRWLLDGQTGPAPI